jgi:hypothetical protein
MFLNTYELHYCTQGSLFYTCFDFVLYGNAMFAEIPTDLVMEVNKVYEIRRFKILPSRTIYKHVDGTLMIQFMVYTQLHVVHDPPSTFPSYIYRVRSGSEYCWSNK